MNRIAICADVKFPKGDAGSNRIEYIARALVECKNEVVVFSVGNEPEIVDKNGYGDYKGIRYKNINLIEGKRRKTLSGFQLVTALKKSSKAFDTVLIYGSNALFVKPLISFCKKKGIKTVVDVVEWHQAFQYRFRTIDPRYLSNRLTFERLALKADNIITLSPLIANYFMARGCKVLNIPVLIDKTELFDFLPEESNRDKYMLIYPGNPEYKDDIISMLNGISMLSVEEKKRIEFHITGVGKNKLKKIIGTEYSLIEGLENVIVHEWLDYEELISLYKKSDFLYMCRFNNLVTEANFPSKLPELMAYGIIPLANKQGSFYHFLDDGVDSVLFSGYTASDCMNAIKKILYMEQEQINSMKKCAQRKAYHIFDYRAWGQQIADFLE